MAMTRFEAVADRVELRALVDRYAVAADSRDREGFAGVFTADGVLAVGPGGGLVGPDAIPAPLDYLDAHYTHTMHLVGNHDVVLDGDTATGTVYCLAHHLSVRGGEMIDSCMGLRYFDRYVRTDDGWRIAHRSTSVDWQEDRPASPPAGPLGPIG
jgi:uncharacterized protein (TIGR02246 family)